MSDTNRRRFLAVAGAGTAAGAVGVVGLAGPANAAARLHKNSAQQPVVAWVSDHKSSELTVMFGEQEVVVKDRDLVTRLLNAAGGNA